MKIDTLQIPAFRSFQGIELPLGARRVLIAGLNGAGKTGVRECIRWILTGVAQGTDAKGAGADVLIPFGGTEAAAAAVISGLGAVQRAYSVKTGMAFGVQGFTGTASAQQQALYDRIGGSPAYLDALLDSSAFLALNHVEAKALVLAILNVRIKLEGDDHEYTLPELDDLYGKAFEERKLVKREFSKMTKPTEPLAPAEGVYALDKIAAALDKLRTEKDTLTSSIGGDRGRRAEIARAVTDKGVAADRLRARFIDEVNIDAVESQLAADQKELEDLATAGSRLTPDPAEEPEVGSPERLTFLRGRHEALLAHKPSEGCVLDPDVRCDTPKQQFTKRAKKVESDIAEISPSSPKAAPPKLPEQRVLTLTKTIETLRTTLTNYRSAEDQIRDLNQEVINLNTEALALPDHAEQDAAIQNLNERITNGEKIRAANVVYHEAHTRFLDGTQAFTDKQAKIAELEDLVSALGPSGVRVQALQAQMGRFEEAVNRFTAPFGLSVVFRLEPWDVIVNDRPVETYSRSEQYRIGIAVQLAVAALSGLSFAVIDELDMLDQKGRDLVGRLIHDAPVDQVIVLQTREDAQKLPALPGWLSFRLAKSGQGRSVISETVQA